MSDHGIWYHKYRPIKLEDYVFKDQTLKQNMIQWVEEPQKMPNLILAGPWGTGKTTLALMFQDLFELDASDFLFINASLNTGIDMIRTNIVNHCENGGWGVLKIVVLDEAEKLSTSAQESLKGVMDAYGEHTRFIFTTNRMSRISEGLVSRSTPIVIDKMDKGDFIDRIVQIAQTEEVFGEDSTNEEALAIQEIIDRYYPDMRKTIEVLQHSIRDGKVVAPSEDVILGTGWADLVVDTLAGMVTIDDLRQRLVELRKDDIEDIYRYLWENVTQLCEKNPVDAVVLIAEYHDRHTRSTFPDITISALLLRLQEYVINETG